MIYSTRIEPDLDLQFLNHVRTAMNPNQYGCMILVRTLLGLKSCEHFTHAPVTLILNKLKMI